MPRLFLQASRITGEHADVPAAGAKHLRALRMLPGSRITVFDEQGREHEAIVKRLGSRGAELEIRASRQADPGPRRPRIALLAGILKGPRMDLVVEKATELGVDHIVPMLTRFTVARVLGDDAGRLDRWRRLAVSAATQCGRSVLPTVAPPTAFDEAITTAVTTGSLGILFWEEQRSLTLRRARDVHPTPPALVLAVGPEGGFAASEVETARTAGFVVSGLGPRTLRAETAAVAALALCQTLWGDLSGES